MLADMIANRFEFSWVFAQIGRFYPKSEMVKSARIPPPSAELVLFQCERGPFSLALNYISWISLS